MISINNKQHLSRSTKHSIIYISIVPLAVFVLVVWVSFHRISDFRNNQINAATSVVNLVTQEITHLIEQRNRLLNIFVNNERSIIKKLARNPRNAKLAEIIGNRMSAYFPEYFTFTLVDKFGDVIIDDFDGYLGEICLLDIKRFSTTGMQSIRVHPNPYLYHTDSIAQVSNRMEDGYFFASFKTKIFSRLLELSSPIDQHLMLVNTKNTDLIEVTEQGSRIVLDREDYKLTKLEKQRILYSKPIAGTDWRLVSLHDEDVFDDYNYDIIVIGSIISFIFLIGSILMSIVLWRAQQQRNLLKKTREEMFSLFSHDLRSPLNSIYGTVQLLAMDLDEHNFDPDMKSLISSAVSNSKHMLSLINDLLDIQKLESGMMSFNFEEIELNSFIQHVIDLNMRTADMQNVGIKFIAKENFYLNIDSQRCQQVLTNLLSNAIKYSPENETVTVAFTSDKYNVAISVTDNGQGISDDIKDMVFDKFAQSTSRETQSVGGTGLGLTIVKYVVEAHGGEVSFKSEAEQGTEFIVTLPLNR